MIALFIMQQQITMISSSHFFKKTFFTIEKQDRGKTNVNQEYGPWCEQTLNPGEMKIKRNKIAKNRYSLTINEEDERQKLNKSDISNTVLFANQNSLIQPSPKQRRYKSNKNKINQENSQKYQNKLPTIKINQSHTDSLKKNINLPKFEGSYLNFITNNNQKSLKRFVSRKEQIAPRFQIYRKCIIAARRMIYDGQQNSLFYNQ